MDDIIICIGDEKSMKLTEKKESHNLAFANGQENQANYRIIVE